MVYQNGNKLAMLSPYFDQVSAQMSHITLHMTGCSNLTALHLNI